MKELDYALDEFQISSLLTSFREKADVIRFWMKATQLILSHVPPTPGTEVGIMRLRIGKMSRLFIESSANSFSVNFPFMVRLDEDGVRIYSHYCDDIDNQTASMVLSLLDGDKLLTRDNVIDFADPLCRVTDEDPQVWHLVRDLLIADDGYLRVDHGPKREDGKRHPLNHIDVFYSSGASFKIGVNGKLSFKEFSDILDIQTDCHFLQK